MGQQKQDKERPSYDGSHCKSAKCLLQPCSHVLAYQFGIIENNGKFREKGGK